MSDTPIQKVAARPAEPPARGRDDMGRRFVAFAFCRADILIEVDDQQRIVFSAGTVHATLGKKSQELAGRPLVEIIHEQDQQLVQDLLRSGAADARVNDVAIRLVSGHQVTSEATISGYRVPDFNNHFFLALKVKPKPPAPPQRRAEELDDETGILGRRSFAAAATERIQSAQEAGLKPQMTMVKIANLDQMKEALGADQHQQVLGKIGDILRNNSIGGDTAGRLDENSFALVHGTDVNVAEMTRDIEAAAVAAGAGEFALETETSTVAVDAPLTDEQMAKAIVYSMQQFCDKGAAGTVGNMSEMLERGMAETMKQVGRFRRICQTRDFDLAYMPICELKSRKVHHVEALARFRTPGDGGSPYKLITMAEEMGLISQFDLAVATKTVDVLKRGGATGRIPPIAINVSGHSIGNAEFVEQLHDILGRAINLRDLISIEITESSKIGDLEGVNRSIQSFRQKGFKVALDDFGAGAAGFDYLNTLDVDAVKFDGPVVKRAFATEKGKAFLASMASLCNQTGIETVAEMVETEELAKFLAGIGVHLGQGYYFAKPTLNLDSFSPGKVLAFEKESVRAT